MSFSMFCPICRHALLHRTAPAPAASRCSGLDCLTVFDDNGNLTDDDPGPWPDPEDVADLVSKGITGSMTDTNVSGGWTFARGTSVYVR